MTDQDPVEGRRQEIIRRASVKDYTWALGGLTCQADIEFLLAECDRLSTALGAREREIAEIGSMLDWVGDALEGQRVSEFGEAFPIVRLALDRVAESARLLQALEGLRAVVHHTIECIEGKVGCTCGVYAACESADALLASCVRHTQREPTRAEPC